MKPVEKVSIIDDVAAQMKDYILSGEVEVGDKFLTEKEISSRLAVGRSTVRESLRLLEAMGYIEMRAGKGAFVAKTSEDDPDVLYRWFASHEPELIDVMEVRMAIEPLAVRLAAARGTAEEIEEIGRAHDNFVQALEKNDVLGLASSDELFHELIVRASHNRLLIAINKSVAKCLIEYRTRSFAVKQNMKNALAPHRAILENLLKKNADEAMRVMQEHLAISLKDISSVVKVIGSEAAR